jgi:hypothetical protein
MAILYNPGAKAWRLSGSIADAVALVQALGISLELTMALFSRKSPIGDWRIAADVKTEGHGSDGADLLS